MTEGNGFSQPIPALRGLALPWEHPARRRAHDRPRHDRDLRIAIFVAIVAFLAVLTGTVHAEPLDAVVRDRLAPALPAGLDVAKVYLPAGLAGLDTAPEAVTIELPRELRAGRSSVKLTVRGHRPAQVPVAIAASVDVAIAQRALAPGEPIGPDDIAIERRALAEIAAAPTATLIGATVTNPIAAGAPIAARDVALPPPQPRGTQVALDVRRGAVRIRGTATLELAARPGEPATARIAATHTVVHGTLVAPATLVVGDLP
ncbi:MAG TPA: flagella basal body P-ring formation protein FlgA [Kofleriaceae bacterium]|nr:flagella basal body P-ring formation protein FlgA [Kofleriaceae bacterium]